MGKEDKNLDFEVEDVVEEKKGISPKKASIVIAVGILLVLIILLTIRSCSISKKVDSGEVSQNGVRVVSSEANQNPAPVEGNTVKQEELPAEAENTDTSNSSETGVNEENTVTPEPSKEEVPEVVEGNLSISEVEEPALGEELSTSTLVSGKSIYRVDDVSYTYSVQLIFPDGDKFKIVKYFCPRKTWESVNSGDSINAVYQVDAEGVISVSSISK